MKYTNQLSIAINCKISISKTVKNYNPRELGKAIVKWAQKYPNLNYSLQHMYVVKHDEIGYYRGQKLFEKPPVAYRDIYFYEQSTRKALSELLPIFDIPAENQIGFTRNRGNWCLIKTEPSRTDLTRIKLDLKDAFNSISQKQIFWLLRKVFDVNTSLANELSHQWTTKGHMLQGHPLAPAIFNLVTRDLNIWLSKRTGIIQYADDILIYENSNYISWKWLKVIFKKYRELGFQINVEKEGIFHKTKDLEFLGLRFTFKDDKPLVSTKRRARRKKIRALERNVKTPNNPVLRGNKNWYNFDAAQIWDKRAPEEAYTEIDTRGHKKKQKRAKKSNTRQEIWKLVANPVTYMGHLREDFNVFS